MTTEALKLALKALEDLGMKHFESTGEVLYKETFTAIKEALAQPMAYLPPTESPENALYTTQQRTWVGLTQEELSEIYNRTEWDTVNGWEYERAIESKLKRKNI